ncbi:MAG TPA: alanine--glyoxylate aminotransferase family protein [Thermoplasmatales archaeon]|nr:alanine--glyoxylate aminotransferase family protein [Thermoplasmatales archaeon]
MHEKLFTPGPTEVREENLQAMATPQIHHRSKAFSDLYAHIQTRLQQLLYTQNPVLLYTSSSTGAMESAVVNGVKKKCLNLVNGAFSKRWHQITKAHNIPCDALALDWNRAIKPDMVKEKLDSGEYDAVTVVLNETSTGMMNPVQEIAEVVQGYPDVLLFVDAVSGMSGVKIEVDNWGLDMCLAGVQKCFALPSGIAVASVSQRLLQRAEELNRGYYFNIPLMYKYHQKNQTRVTPAISQMFALKNQMDYIIDQEGLDNRFARHDRLAGIVQKWAKKHFDIYPEEGYWSKTLTCVKNTRGISVADLNKELANHHLRISNGYGDLKEQTFRIAHMGDLQVNDIYGLLSTIEDILDL